MYRVSKKTPLKEKLITSLRGVFLGHLVRSQDLLKVIGSRPNEPHHQLCLRHCRSRHNAHCFIIDANFVSTWTPLNKLNVFLLLHDFNCSIDIIWSYISSIQKHASNIFSCEYEDRGCPKKCQNIYLQMDCKPPFDFLAQSKQL